MKKNIIYILVTIFFIVTIIGSILLIKKNENYSMTLGNYGNPEPSSCSEEKPNVRFNHLYICNSCNLGCSTKDSWGNCQKCMEKLNNILPGVL